MAVVVLLAASGVAQAEGGYERIRDFQQAFKAEQQRLWGDQRQQLQQVERGKQQPTKKADG